MHAQTQEGSWWAMLAVWGIVNAVCLLQGVGFLSRIPTGTMAINRVIGYVIAALAIPAALALAALVRAGADWRQWAGPALYLAFVAMMVAVEYVWPTEFRSPPRYDILVPYLVLFFGSIVLMGAPMLRVNRGLWLVTVASSAFLVGSMLLAMRKGVG